MEDYPRDLMDFETRFATEDACRAYLAQLRWPDGFQCPGCAGESAWKTDRDLWLCQRCGLQTSLLAGTVFQNTKKPLQMWFRAMWHITGQKHGGNALGLQRTLGLGSYRTAWSWLHKLRRAMVRPGRDRLSGVVQTDETYVGGVKSGPRGRGAEGKSLVLIMVQDKGGRVGRIRLARVADASSASLVPAVSAGVAPGSTISTDGWTGYEGLSEAGYTRVIARSESVVGDDLLPLPHLVASLLKRWILGTYQGSVSPEHLDYYLDEFTFRFNRRTSASRGKLFYRLVQQAAQVDPVPVQQIIGGKAHPISSG